jgi:hypothetical protein
MIDINNLLLYQSGSPCHSVTLLFSSITWVERNILCTRLNSALSGLHGSEGAEPLLAEPPTNYEEWNPVEFGATLGKPFGPQLRQSWAA